MSWLRLYTDFVYSRKVCRLPEKMQARLVKLWCLHQSGHLVGASTADLAYELRLPEREVKETLGVLTKAGFLDPDGTPHNWDKRQFASDNTTARTRAHRERSRERSEEPDGERSGERSGNVRGNGQNRTEQNRAEQSPHVAPAGAPCTRPPEARKRRGAIIPAEAIRLASLLADLILVRDPKAKVDPDGWAHDLEKLHRLDGRDWQEIERVLLWTQADSFEQTVVLSAGKLRKRFTELLAKAKRAGPVPLAMPAPLRDAAEARLQREAELAAGGQP